MKAQNLPPLTDERRRLVEENRHLAYWAVGAWPELTRRLGRYEVISVANLAISEAAARFNEDLASFRTYAIECIKGRLKTAASGRCDLIRIKSERCGVRLNLASLDAPLMNERRPASAQDERTLTLGDLLPCRRSPAGLDVDTRDAVRKALRRLTPRRRKAIRLRFTKGMTCGEIGKSLGVTRSRAHDLVRLALADLAKLLKCHQ